MKTHILLSIIAITSLLLFSCSKKYVGNEENSGNTVTIIDGNELIKVSKSIIPCVIFYLHANLLQNFINLPNLPGSVSDT